MDILSAVKHHHMFDPGDRVLVAVSGGPDSIALLHNLHTRSSEFGITLHIAHLNHGIRGEAADLDEQFVREFAESLGLDCTVKRVDVPALKSELKAGEEETARIVRYEFLQETANDIGADKIAVGHNADDRAESVLFNIIRGAGIDGLGSIRPVRGNIVRPLIHTTRREIETYISENALPFRVDESNMDIAYSRNRIRHEMLPMLESDYNSEIRAALVRLADIASDISDFMNQSSAKSLAGLLYKDAWDAGLFSELPTALQRQILRSRIEELKGDLKDVSLEQIDRVIEALRTGEDFKITLPTGRIFAVRQKESFTIAKSEPLEKIMPFDRPLNVPGVTQIPETGCSIEASIVENPLPRKLGLHEAVIDTAKIKGMLRVRDLQPGDRITPFGMHESKKLQDVFVDKKVRRTERAKAMIVTDGEKVIWVAGVVSSEETRITNDTKQAILLTIN